MVRGDVLFFVFWVLVLILATVLILVLTHLFGKKVYNAADKIYVSFTADDEEDLPAEENAEESAEKQKGEEI